MAPIVPRLAGAYLGLNYEIFPFDGFDNNGRVRVPERVVIPEHWRADFAAAQSAPLWNAVFKALSVLDNREPEWRCYALGVGFGRDGIRLMPAKSLSSVASPTAAAQWTTAYGEVILRSVQELAGRRYVVHPAWLQALRGVLAIFKGEGGGAGDEGEGGEGNGQGHRAAMLGGREPDGEERPADDGEVAVAVVGVGALAVSFVLAVLEAAESLTVGQRVTSTNIWFVPEGWPPLGEAGAARWSTLSPVSRWSGNRRVVNAVWDGGIRQLWHWNHLHPWNQGFGWAPHKPQQLWQALYPAGQLEEREFGEVALVGAVMP